MESGSGSGKGGARDLIVEAIEEAERLTTGEIRVHLSHRWFDPQPLKRAHRLFAHFEMSRTRHRNGVLLYVNLRRRRLAIVGDQALHDRVGQGFWDKIIAELKADLRATNPENAIALAVTRVGAELHRLFPAGKGKKPRNELPNEVSED